MVLQKIWDTFSEVTDLIFIFENVTKETYCQMILQFLFIKDMKKALLLLKKRYRSRHNP